MKWRRREREGERSQSPSAPARTGDTITHAQKIAAISLTIVFLGLVIGGGRLERSREL